jgi:NAD(P)-dependent dehydrogenase (short-subunit alcohol dehydrogenase family)
MAKKSFPALHQRQQLGREHKMTALIPSIFPAEEVASSGNNVPMKRAGQPMEVAPCHVFLACADSACMTGQVLHPNGGEIING